MKFQKCGKGVIGVVMATVLAVAGLSSALPARSDESASTEPEKVDPASITVGVRADAKPFSYRKEVSVTGGESILGGYGGYVIDVCREVLREMASAGDLGPFEVVTVETEARSRFEDLGNGKVDMLCGPDSITPDRLSNFQVSFPVFLAGMSYAYVDPASALFPKSRYCGNIIGVVNGTTAETSGLADLARSDLLMRFDDALDRELALDARRLEKVGKMLREEIFGATLPVESGWLSSSASNESIQRVIDSTRGTAMGKVRDAIGRRHGKINRWMAQQILTEECPAGFIGLPVRRYPSHESGIADFCAGKVLYYLGDYDIIKSKIEEVSGCDVVLNRFTRSKEVYGVFFRKPDEIGQCVPTCSAAPTDDSARLFALFNNTLFELMQGDVSRVEELFEDEFGEGRMSADLRQFFSSFKMLAPPRGAGD